ncbi:MAG: lipocalin family protein [Idiomarina sp.]|nr:lipocalin family protein [Idiomarina sp.]
MRLLTIALLSLLLTACLHEVTPVKAPVERLDVERYMGTWYEIARMPTSFQRDMSQATASYRLNADGTFEVVNRGFNTRKGEWKTAVGKGRPIDGMAAGFTVSFQWPFKGGYYIAELGDNYEYAVIVSDSTDYLWILAREPHMPRWLLDRTLARAHEWGYDIDQIIETAH